MKLRRVAAALVLIVAGGAAVATGVAHGATAVQAAPAGGLLADFNNDGADDLAVGVPFEFLGSIQDAGAVKVLYGSADRLTGTGASSSPSPAPGSPAAPTRRTTSASPWPPGDRVPDGAGGAPAEPGHQRGQASVACSRRRAT